MRKKQEEEKNSVDTMDEGLSIGVYRIMKNIPSYRLEHIFSDDFTSAQFFALNDLITHDFEQQEKKYQEQKKENEKGKKK